MAQASGPTTYIYQGFWVNANKGGLWGMTVTLEPTNATLLTNALTMLVSLTGGCFWTILRFLIHQAYESRGHNKHRSLMHNQYQTILKNTPTAVQSIRLTLGLAWTSWRDSSKPSKSQAVVIAIVASFNTAFFAITATISGSLVDAGTTVLSRSPSCGAWDQTYLDIATQRFNSTNSTNAEELALSTEYMDKLNDDVQLSETFAKQCYDEFSERLDTNCGRQATGFGAPRLNFTTTYATSCPFKGDVCSLDVDTIQFDTGTLNSYDEFAINAGPRDRLTYRRYTECKVLNDTAFTTNFMKDSNDTAVNVAYAHYGPSLIRDTEFTYSFSNFADFYTNFTADTALPYQLDIQVSNDQSQSLESPTFSASPTFSPIAELVPVDADLTLMFLSFSGEFLEPVNDPWFSAHIVNPGSSLADQATFLSDRPIRSLACTEQHQVCVGTGDASLCSSLHGLSQLRNEFRSSFTLTSKQNVTFDRLLRAASASSMYSITSSIARSSNPLLALNASMTGSTTLSFALPDDQWQLEVRRWHNIAMAHLQRMMVEYATGQVAPQTSYLLPAQTDGERWLCNNLMVPSTAFRSFSVLMLTLMTIVACLIMAVSFTIESLVSWFQLKLNKGIHARGMWLDHDMLGPQQWRKETEGKSSSLRRSDGSSTSSRTYSSSWRHELDMSSLQLYSEKLLSWKQKSLT